MNEEEVDVVLRIGTTLCKGQSVSRLEEESRHQHLPRFEKVRSELLDHVNDGRRFRTAQPGLRRNASKTYILFPFNQVFHDLLVFSSSVKAHAFLNLLQDLALCA